MPDNSDSDTSPYVEYVRIITDCSVNSSTIVYHMVSGSLASQRSIFRYCNQLIPFGHTGRRFEETTALYVHT
jgi:hypothetical protein